MQHTAIADLPLPDYTRGEERFNSISHIAGAGIGFLILLVSVVFSALRGNACAVLSSVVYGHSMVALYTVSGIYHGLKPGLAKKIFRVLDHCTIYLLIAGTYTPVALCAVRLVSPAWGWILFGLVWGIAAIAIVFTAIDLQRYSVLSMCCYIGMGWCIVLAAKPALQAIPADGVIWLLAGGIAYTAGAILYGIGKKRRYVHGLFHLFVIAGSVLQFLCVFFSILLRV